MKHQTALDWDYNGRSYVRDQALEDWEAAQSVKASIQEAQRIQRVRECGRELQGDRKEIHTTRIALKLSMPIAEVQRLLMRAKKSKQIKGANGYWDFRG